MNNHAHITRLQAGPGNIYRQDNWYSVAQAPLGFHRVGTKRYLGGQELRMGNVSSIDYNHLNVHRKAYP